jgi:hypothetical protein
MSTVVFNSATPKRMLFFFSSLFFPPFPFFFYYSFLIILAGFGQDARTRPSRRSTCTLALSFEHPPTDSDLTVGVDFCWKNKYDLASHGILARNWIKRCSIPTP